MSSSHSSDSSSKVNPRRHHNHQSKPEQPPPPTKALENPPAPSSLEKYNTFHGFPDLPKELRDLIWQHSIEVSLQPRVHVLTYRANKTYMEKTNDIVVNSMYYYNPYVGNGYWTFMTGPNPVPSVCQEARLWSTKHFSTLKSHKVITTREDYKNSHRKQWRWFNFEKDTLVLDYHSAEWDDRLGYLMSPLNPCWPLYDPPDFTNSIKELAITSSLWYGNLTSEEIKTIFRETEQDPFILDQNSNFDLFWRFLNLEKVSLVYSKPIMLPKSANSISGLKDAEDNLECYIYNNISLEEIENRPENSELFFRHFESYFKNLYLVTRDDKAVPRVHLVTADGLNKD